MSVDHGSVLLTWEFPEYEQHERGRAWYTVAAIVGAALLTYAFASRNFLFAVLVVMLAVVFYLRESQRPPQLTCVLAEKGILLDGRFTPYEGFHDFWIATEDGAPPKLFLHHRGIRPRFGIPLAGTEPATVRAALHGHLSENEEEHGEPTADVVGRALRL